MNRFLDDILSDMDWRSGEIGTIKALTTQTHLSDNKRSISRKYAVPALYAVWEGFVVQSFSKYVTIINKSNIEYSQLNINLLTYQMFHSLNMHKPPQNHNKRKDYIVNLFNKKNTLVDIPLIIDTKSNVNSKQFHAMCLNYGIVSDSLKKYDNTLNKFVNIRNKIAHGDNAVLVDSEMIYEFSQLIVDLMTELYLILDNCVQNKVFLNQEKG